MRRRRGLFHSITRGQIYVALIAGMLSSAYIWLPLVRELELERKAKSNAQESSNKIAGNMQYFIDSHYIGFTVNAPFHIFTKGEL